MHFKQEKKSNRLVLRLSGDLIEEGAGAPLIEAAREALDQDLRVCILDISELQYINSHGIGVLIVILTKFRNRGGDVFLIKPPERIKKLLAITKLSTIFQVVETEEKAVELYKQIIL